MRDRWSDEDARGAVDRYAAEDVSEDVALRVYTTRLLGADPRLVLHGGGNSSVKSRATDVLGREVEALFVKGSGWDMGSIEPAGLPAVELAPLLELEALEELSDEEMVNQHRRALLDSAAPSPSVETLLHAWIPHRFIDHTHANAVLALTDQPRGEELCGELYGDRVAIVPYIMPGFALAKAAKAAFDATPDVEGMVLLKHGIFTFGATAREAYERMIELVAAAEERVEAGRRTSFAAAPLPDPLAAPEAIAPIVRGALALEVGPGDGDHRRFLLDFRTSPEIRAYVSGEEVTRYACAGTVTPDHVIRTKPRPLILRAPLAGDLEAWAARARDAVARYRAAYGAYFERHAARHGGGLTPLDASPRVVLVPGVGLFAAGEDARAAAVAADLAEATVEVVSAAEAMDRFESIAEADLFDVEYWSLEQAKLGRRKEKPLARHVAVVTGGAGAIGRATAAAFREAGCEVALLDVAGERLRRVAGDMGALAVECDLTDDAAVDRAIDAVIGAFGGVDILVSNAGAAWQGRVADVADDVLRESFELNFFAHQRVARAAVRVMRAQGTGGCLLFSVSKQAVNPGPAFGPYGLPKAATMALVRQYALEHGADGIRSNGVNADRIRSGILTDDMVAARAAARGVDEEEYMRGNLLGREVRAEDVGRAFVALALARATTGAILTVDGGNVAAALR